MVFKRGVSNTNAGQTDRQHVPIPAREMKRKTCFVLVLVGKGFKKVILKPWGLDFFYPPTPRHFLFYGGPSHILP